MSKTIRICDKQPWQPQTIEEISKMIEATKQEMSFWRGGIDDEGFNYNRYLENLIAIKSNLRENLIDKILE